MNHNIDTWVRTLSLYYYVQYTKEYTIHRKGIFSRTKQHCLKALPNISGNIFTINNLYTLHYNPLFPIKK